MFVVIYMHSPSVLPSVLPHVYLVKTHLHPIFWQILKLNCHFSRLRTKRRKDKDLYNPYIDYIIYCEK